MQKIKMKVEYPDNYAQIVGSLLNESQKIVAQCNADTVNIPIESLNYLIGIDDDITRQHGDALMQITVDLYEKYHEDIMLLDDILSLFSALGRTKNN